MLGYVSPVLAPTSKKQQFLNNIRNLMGSTKPVACWMPDAGDGKASVDPISGRIWTAETITNLVTNGGFEAGTTGWAGFSTGTIAQDSTQFKYGTHSGKVTSAAAFDGAQFSITLTTTVTYTLSCWAMVPTGKTFAIKILDAAATPVSPTTNLTGATGVWQYVTMTWVCGTAATFLQAFDNAASSYPYDAFIDGLQIETGSVVHPYIDTTVATATATSPMWAKGFGQGGVRVFDGVTNYLSTPDAAALSFGNSAVDVPFSIFAVGNATSTATVKTVISKDDTSAVQEWLFAISTSNEMRLVAVDQSAVAGTIRDANTPVTLSTFRTFCATYNSTGGATNMNGALVYENGVAITSTATNSASYVAMEDLTSPVLIGATSGTIANFYQGQLALVLATPIAFSAAQVLALHNAARQYFQF